MRNFGKKVRLGLIGLSAATLMVGATAIPAAAATPHPLRAAKCSGESIDSWQITSGRRVLGKVVLYWNGKTGTNCAMTIHSKGLQGKSLRTSVFIAACKERSGSRCTYLPGSPQAEDGTFESYAGPVSIHAPGRCVHVAGDIYLNGKHHVDSKPWLSHCS